jgi:hypothetical protein
MDLWHTFIFQYIEFGILVLEDIEHVLFGCQFAHIYQSSSLFNTWNVNYNQLIFLLSFVFII